MQYDPVKRQLGSVFKRSPFLRRLFYRLLDLLLLRAWHVHRELRAWARGVGDKALHLYDAGAGYGQYSYWLSGRLPKARITAIDVKEEQVADCNAFLTSSCRIRLALSSPSVTTINSPLVR